MKDQNRNTKKPAGRSSSLSVMFALAASSALLAPQSAEAFTVAGAPCHILRSTQLQDAASSPDDDITRQLERAKAILAKSKAKIEAQEQDAETEGDKKAVPFFASKTGTAGKRDKVIKSTNEEGLFTTDGEKMAELSESEEWEIRSLFEVFRNEGGVQQDSLADRDVAASIFGLQRQLRNEDYKEIFNSRNRFIGEQ